MKENPGLLVKSFLFISEETATGGVLYKKAILKSFTILTGKHLYWSLFLIKLQISRSALYLKESPTQVFSCKYYKIVKNTYIF